MSDFSPLYEVATLLERVAARWWVVGGWAVDLRLGRLTRPHADIDILILDRDVAEFAAALPEAYAEHAATGEWIDWDRCSPLQPGRDSLAVERDFGGGVTRLQALVGLSDGDEWVYHRGKRTIRVALVDLGRRSEFGVAYLAPAVVLLFKSRELREKDTSDFLALLTELTIDERSWLRDRVEQWRRDHPWLAHLGDLPYERQ